MNRSGAVATFWALSDSVRLEILDHIADGSNVTVTQLAEALPITRQAVSRHVRTLEEAGLVVGERLGREQRYRADPEPLDAASGWLRSRAASWERSLERLARYVENSD